MDVLAITNMTTTVQVAIRKLLTGPATAVKMSSVTGFLKFLGSTGVGLAQPITGKCVTSAMRGITIVPTGSMCLIGLREMRPNMRAVGSPHRLAVQAWADSCTLIANRNAIIWKTTLTISMWLRSIEMARF